MFTVNQTLGGKGVMLQTSSYANVTGTVVYTDPIKPIHEKPILNTLECFLAYKASEASGRRLGHKRSSESLNLMLATESVH